MKLDDLDDITYMKVIMEWIKERSRDTTLSWFKGSHKEYCQNLKGGKK